MAMHEAWLEKMLTTLETKEKERISRGEERRKREAASLEEEHKFWAKERAWIEARDVALVEALERLSGLINSSSLVANQRASQKGET